MFNMTAYKLNRALFLSFSSDVLFMLPPYSPLLWPEGCGHSASKPRPRSDAAPLSRRTPLLARVKRTYTPGNENAEETKSGGTEDITRHEHLRDKQRTTDAIQFKPSPPQSVLFSLNGPITPGLSTVG